MNRLEEFTDDWYHSGNSHPVARSIAILELAGVLEYVEGHTRGLSLYPFTVCIKDPQTGKKRFACKPTELHALAKEFTKEEENV